MIKSLTTLSATQPNARSHVRRTSVQHTKHMNMVVKEPDGLNEKRHKAISQTPAEINGTTATRINSCVSVFFHCSFSNNFQSIQLKHCYWHLPPIISKDSGHSQFFCNYTGTHIDLLLLVAIKV